MDDDEGFPFLVMVSMLGVDGVKVNIHGSILDQTEKNDS